MTEKNKCLSKIIMISMVSLLVCFSVIGLSHADVTCLAKWGVELLEHIKNGNTSMYYVDMFNTGEGNNYNFFQTLVLSMACFPVYCVAKVFKVEVSYLLYQTSIKLTVAIMHVLCAYEIYKVIIKLTEQSRKAFISAMLYLACPVVIMHGIGIGQIDGIGVLLFLLSLLFYLDKKYYKMAICIGFAILSKYFLLMIYVPVALMKICEIKKWYKYMIIAFLIPLMNRIVTNILFIDARRQASIHNSQVFIPRLFTENIDGRVSIFLLMLLLLCGIMLAIGLRGKGRDYIALLMPVIIFWFFLLLVFWHPQWIIYMIPLLLIMSSYVKHEIEILLYAFGANIGFTIFSMSAFSALPYSSVLVKESVLGKFVPGDETRFVTPWLFERFTENIMTLGGTILMASILMIIIIFIIDLKNNRFEMISNNTVQIKTRWLSDLLWLLTIMVPTVVYIIVLYAVYMGVV